MVSRPCLDCGAATKATRCPDCTSARNIARGSSTARGYNSRWRALSERIRRRNPLCGLRYPGCAFLAVDVDHVIPVRAGGRSVRSNAVPVCRPCHARKTREDQERYPVHV